MTKIPTSGEYSPDARSASAQPTSQAIRFAGLRLTPLSVDATVKALAERPLQAPFAAFVTPNVEHAFLKRKNLEFSACNDTCWISTNDSRVLRAAGRLAGLELEFAPGAYVVRDLFKQVIKPDTTISIVGGNEALVTKLTAQFGLTSVAQHIPPMGFIHNPNAVAAAIEFVATHPAQYVFVAMGPPQSEIFCQRIIADGRSTGIGLCIGSSLSVLTNDLAPAPDWMERSGLVWLYRLLREPRRLWRRYLVRGVMGAALCVRDIVAIRLGLLHAAIDA